MDITEINAIEYGGAIAHVAAAQLFQILTATENMAGAAAVNWFGGEEGPDDGAATVLLLAEYVTKRGAGGERVWIWGSINGLIVVDVPESRQFADVILARRLAFDMFASVCLRSFEQLTTLQEAEFAARQLEQRENPPIALEDSIFEPIGSLGELEKHAPEFLAALSWAVPSELVVLNVGINDAQYQPTMSIGADTWTMGADHCGQVTPPLSTMSIGAAAPAAGEANEEEIADQGQEAGGETAADPDRATEVRDGDAGNGTGGQDPGNDGAGTEAGKDAEAGKQVAQPTDAQPGQSDGVSEPASARQNVKKPSRGQRRRK